MQNKRFGTRGEMSSKIVLGLPPSEKLAKSVARRIKCNYAKLKLSKFPDGEFYIRFPTEVRKKELPLCMVFILYFA